MAIPPKKTPTSRLPAPSLFVGPPSRNASNTSLLSPQPHHPSQRTHLVPGTADDYNATATNLSPSRPVSPAPQQQQTDATSNAALGNSPAAAERIEALWAQMQSTLEEVELNAAGTQSGAARFGSGHARALEELRGAQIALAQAWGRSAEDDADADVAVQSVSQEGVEKHKRRGSDHADTLNSTGNLLSAAAAAVGSGTSGGIGHSRKARSRTGSSSKSERAALEEETERDVQIARSRREANDRYFQRVNDGVTDVVTKLEEVARAMKQVEVESKEMWSEADSIDSRSQP